MKLEVIVNKKRGVVNITSEQFIIEDLKTHVCKKLELNESDFKVKINLGECPSMELIKQPLFRVNSKSIPLVEYAKQKGEYELIERPDFIPDIEKGYEYVIVNEYSEDPIKLYSDSHDMNRFYWKLPFFLSGTILSIYKRKTTFPDGRKEEFIMKIRIIKDQGEV